MIMDNKKFSTFAEDYSSEEMGKRIQTAVLVELDAPPQGYKQKYIFGSKAAIFDEISPDVLGISLRTLWLKKMEFDVPIRTRKGTITMMQLLTKRQENPAQ